MEPVSTLVGTISKVLLAMAKAVMTVSRNRERCRDLARRAEAVASVLDVTARAVLEAGSDAEAARRSILCCLKDALDDALALVESCRQRQSIVSKLCSSSRRAARFDDVDKRITNCLVELSAANGASIENKVDGLAAARCCRHSAARQPPPPLAHAFLPCYPKLPLAHAGVPCFYPSGDSYGYVIHMEEDRTSRPPPPPLAHAGVPCNCYPSEHGYVSTAVIAEEPTWLQVLQHGVKRALMSAM